METHVALKRIPQLDGLRGLAVLSVLLAHCPLILGNWLDSLIRLVSRGFQLGYLGVDLFFLLSGFLITSILVRDEGLTFKKRYWRFYARRSIRIFPIYYLTIIVCQIFFSKYDYWYNYLYISNYWFSFDLAPHPLRHTWSLAVEEQFYLLWPVIIWEFRQFRMKLLYVIMAVSVGTACLYEYIDCSQLVYRSLETRMLSLAVGSYFALQGLPRFSTKCLLFALVGLYAIVQVVVGMRYFSMGIELYERLLFQPVFCAISAVLFLLAINSTGLARQILCSKCLAFIGAISYALYLFHLPVLYAFGAINVENSQPIGWSVFLLFVFSLFTLSVLSRYLVELPLLKIRPS